MFLSLEARYLPPGFLFLANRPPGSRTNIFRVPGPSNPGNNILPPVQRTSFPELTITCTPTPVSIALMQAVELPSVRLHAPSQGTAMGGGWPKEENDRIFYDIIKRG